MQAHKVKVTIPENHRVELRLPDDFPAGPAEVIVLAARSGNPEGNFESAEQARALAGLEQLRSVSLTREEEDVLDQFEDFRREHPFRLSSLMDEDG